jgi:hypothetical protein
MLTTAENELLTHTSVEVPSELDISADWWPPYFEGSRPKLVPV